MFFLKQSKRFLAFLVIFLIPLVAFAQGPFSGTTKGKLAVTPAGFDDMGDVLKKLGFSADGIEESDLATLSNIEKYDALYINCSGSIDSVADDVKAALRDYVKNGGIVYASDYANSLIQAAFPGKINFYKGSLIPGTTAEDTAQSFRVGVPGKVQAKVVDTGLAAVLGKTTVEVNYDLGAWAVIDSVGSGSRVHMKGPVSIMDFSGADPEAWQEFGNIDWSNPSALEEFNKKWAKLGKSVGDKPYVVSFSEGKGEVLYTTFHNEAQATSDVKSVLNWFGIRTKAGRLAQATRELTVQGENEVLQEVVDGINKGETKNYFFNASGAADFSITLNFGGSSLSLKVTDPQGKKVTSQDVEKPPFTQSVKATKGNYKMEVKGVDVPEQNMPFVLLVTGPKKAMAETTTEQPVQPTKIAVPAYLSLLVVIGLVAVGIILVIIGIVIMVVRRKIKEVLPWLLIGLGIIFILGAILFNFMTVPIFKVFSGPQKTPQQETTPSKTETTPSTTETEKPKTVSDVHCLQKPTKGDQITIENLTDYQTAQSPLTFSGRANAFENQFNFRLKDCRGPIITEGTVTAEGEMGTMPPYSKTITFTLSRSPMDAILEVYALSEADGSEIELTQVPVRLTK